jgi:hypothetical protein
MKTANTKRATTMALLAATLGIGASTSQAQSATTTTNPATTVASPPKTSTAPKAPIPESPAKATWRSEIDAVYKGDYRNAFVQKKPELFLNHLGDEFINETVEGQTLDAATLKKIFPALFVNMVKTIEHNVSIEEIDVVSPSKANALVTQYTLIEYRGPQGNYLVTTLGTFRDTWEKRGGKLIETSGKQLRNQTITFARP